jgi:hypothetical protein
VAAVSLTISNKARLALLSCVFPAVLIVAPAAASAADRFASPGGTGTAPCASNDPCPIAVAVNGASNGDDITLLAGTYTSSVFLGFDCPSSCTPVSGITVHGTPGSPPVINMTASGGLGIDMVNGSTLRDVVVNGSVGSTSLVAAFGNSTIERVVAHESGVDSRACALGSESTIRDSVCWHTGAAGPNASAVGAFPQFGISTDTATLRNVTAVSTTDYGMRAVSASSNSAGMALTATNVIARGGGGVGGEDVHTERLTGTSATPVQQVTLDHSNYVTESEQDAGDITDPNTGTNTNVAPVFVDATTGDFHQTALSTGTLDLGTATGVLSGELDLDAQPRIRGTAPDIGADELPVVPPAPTLTGTSPGSGANNNNPKVMGSAEPLSAVDLYPNATCAGSPAASDLAEVLASPGFPATVPDNSTTTFSAIATNEVGPSPCSSVNVTYFEVTPPPASPPPATTPTPTPTPTSTPSTTTTKKKCKNKKKHRAAVSKKCKKKKRK